MFRRPIKEINAEFPAQDKYLDSIQQIVREACAAAGMPRKQVTAVLLAIEEGASNIIRHAYLYETGTLRVRIVIYKRMIAFSLIDSGRSFQPDSHGRLDLQKLVESGRRGGLGFYMVQKIMDSVEYITSAGFNELRMIKRLDADTRHTPPLLRRMFNLRVKFSISTFLIILLITSAVYYFVNARTVEEVHAHLDETVAALATTIADQAAGYIINRRSDVEFDQLTVSYKGSNPFLYRIVITDSVNIILAHSDDIRRIREAYRPPAGSRSNKPGVPQRLGGTGEKKLNYLMFPVTAGEHVLGAIHMTYASETIYAKLKDAREQMLLLTAGLLLIGVIGVYLLSSHFVTPIVRITQRVRRFSSGDLETELPLEGSDEFFEISRALNDMMNRLSRDRKNIIEREKMAKEIEVASQIQKTLLPRNLPQLPELEVDAFYRAASVIGGDLYDVFEIGEGRYCLVVADVSGKGVPASLVMSMVRTVIQIHAQSSLSAKDTLMAVNDYLTRNIPPGMFITVLLAIFSVEDRRLNLVSAGHNPMIYFRAGTRQLTKINPAGMPLGVPITLGRTFEESLEEVNIQLGPGDVILLYTDGITEATNRDGQQYGIDRLTEFVRDQFRNGSSKPISDLTRGIVDEIDSFSGFAKQNDDITFVIARASDKDERQASDKSVSTELLDAGDSQQEGAGS